MFVELFEYKPAYPRHPRTFKSVYVNANHVVRCFPHSLTEADGPWSGTHVVLTVGGHILVNNLYEEVTAKLRKAAQ